MDFLHDRQTRRYCKALAAVGALLIACMLLLCFVQAREAKKMLLSHDRAFISALLMRGVPEEDIAAALKEPGETAQGAAFLRRYGWTDAAPMETVPAVKAFFARSLLPALAAACALLLLAGLTARRYLLEREKLYRAAAEAVEREVEGDFSAHLPRGGDGTLYGLFQKVDGLAMALKAKGESERRARESLKDAVSDISHQLKTPLAALSLYNEILFKEAEDPAAVRQFADKSARSLKRMEDLIQALLKVMRLDAGSVSFKKERCYACDVAARAVQELRTRAAQEDKQLVIAGDSDAALSCDPVWTAEAIGNLVKNALEHTRSGGHICLSWERSPAMLRFHVKDDGDGIQPDDLNHIFKRFYRSRHASDTQGVGLGLPLAKSIVEGQGGTLSVQSQPGEGTAFTAAFLTES